MDTKLQRFMINAHPTVVGVFDALCASAYTDRDAGFNCLMLDFFAGNPYMQSQLGHAEYRDWMIKTREFVMNHCP